MNDALSQPRATSRIPRFFQSAWKLPLVVAAGTMVWAAMLWLTAAVDSWHGFGEEFAPGAVLVLAVLGGLVGGACLLVVVWLLVQTVLCCCHRRWMSLLRSWGCVVVLPAGHPAGRIELRGYEVSTGKAVQNVQGNMSVEPLGNVCSVAGYAMLGVISGEENEFYATEWEIWFTPEEDGAPRCIGRQEFLIMGGDSW